MQPLVFTSSTWDGTYKAEDMAQVGVFYYPISTFKPDNGVFPSIQLEIYDLKNPGVPILIEVPVESIKKVWSDFAPYTGDYSYVEEFHQKAQNQMSEEDQMMCASLLLGGAAIILLLSI